MSFPFLVNSIALLFSFFVVGVLCGVLFFTLRPHLSRRNDFVLTRSPHNPILKPTANTWENKAVFNPGALALGGRTHLLYRAIGHDGISRFGYASSKDGIAFDDKGGKTRINAVQCDKRSQCADVEIVIERVDPQFRIFAAQIGEDVPRAAAIIAVARV